MSGPWRSPGRSWLAAQATPGSLAPPCAGHLKPGNLTRGHDGNHVTIEGATSLAFSDDVGARLTAMGWNAIRLLDDNDTAAGAGRAGRRHRRRTLRRLGSAPSAASPLEAST